MREHASLSLQIGPRTLVWGVRTYIMGVINVSPESFSGDGVDDVGAAVERARQFVHDGADIIDVGGQSTRPGKRGTDAGFDEITPEEEVRRVVPVIERLRREMREAAVSIDTYKSDVAHAAIDAGAHMVNDIDGFRGDPQMAHIVARARIPAVVMHNQRGRRAGDVISAIRAGLEESLAIAAEAGIPREQLIIDPGFGFGWSPEHNIEMLRRLRELRCIGAPLLVGTSRKSSIGAVLGDVPVEERLLGTAASVALAIANGADIVRVHDVAAMKQVALVADAVVRGWQPQAD